MKVELTTKLTQKELVMGRHLFLKDTKKTFDNDCNILITREHFNQVRYDLMVVLKYREILLIKKIRRKFLL